MFNCFAPQVDTDTDADFDDLLTILYTSRINKSQDDYNSHKQQDLTENT